MADGTSGVTVRSLAVSPDPTRRQGRVEALLANDSPKATPPSILLLYFYDSDNRIRDRISIRVPPVEPSKDRLVTAVFRLKNTGFFTYTAELRPAEQQ